MWIKLGSALRSMRIMASEPLRRTNGEHLQAHEDKTATEECLEDFAPQAGVDA